MTYRVQWSEDEDILDGFGESVTLLVGFRMNYLEVPENTTEKKKKKVVDHKIKSVANQDPNEQLLNSSKVESHIHTT